MNNQHYSVLLRESIDALISSNRGVYVDGTFGRGGHSKAILDKLDKDGRLLAFDKDPRAIAVGRELQQHDARFEIVHSSFVGIEPVLTSRSLQVDGVLLDLGVSSPQLDAAERGFSFMRDGPLDMRMDNSRGISAQEWIASAEVFEMIKVFREYGEERFAKRIAQRIADTRVHEVIDTTMKLARIIEEAVPKKDENKHPATRVFQAIRIEINDELRDLDAVLSASMTVLKPGGRMVVISFHSLEDRMVKRFFRKFSQSQDFPMGLPVTHDMLKAPLKIIGKAQKASDAEIVENVRSRSAIMRVAERCEC